MLTEVVKDNMRVLVAVGVGGVVVGVVATVAVQHMMASIDSKLSGVTKQMERLQREMSTIRHQLEQQQRAKGDSSHVFSSYANMTTNPPDDEDDDEDEDIFEEAQENPPIIVRSPSDGSLCNTWYGSAPQSPLSSDDEYQSVSSGSNLIPTFSSPEQLYNTVDRLLDGSDEEQEQAYQIIGKFVDKYGRDGDFMWRGAKAAFLCSQVAGSRDDKEQQKYLVYTSNDLATVALEIDETNANAHKWYAITLGSLGDYESIQTKIMNGYKFKEHIERSIQLNPTDPSPYYLLGRWCYGVYMLTWMERKIAATLFASPPSASIDEALVHFQKAQNLQTKPWKENMLYLAKCFIEKSNYQAAASWLSQADKLPSKSSEEQAVQVEVENLLQKYQRYL